MLCKYRSCAGVLALAAWIPIGATAQSNVKVSDDVKSAATLAVPIDPATRVDPGRMPRDLGRQALESLGVRSEQIAAERSATYSATRLEDGAGQLAVYYTSLVKQGERWVFFGEDLPKGTVRLAGEAQVSLATVRDARYLVDFVMDSADQEFAVVSGDIRTTQTPIAGHLALVVSGSGKQHKVRVLPLGDSQYQARRFTLFEVNVTPLK